MVENESFDVGRSMDAKGKKRVTRKSEGLSPSLCCKSFHSPYLPFFFLSIFSLSLCDLSLSLPLALIHLDGFGKIVDCLVQLFVFFLQRRKKREKRERKERTRARARRERGESERGNRGEYRGSERKNKTRLAIVPFQEGPSVPSLHFNIISSPQPPSLPFLPHSRASFHPHPFPTILSSFSLPTFPQVLPAAFRRAPHWSAPRPLHALVPGPWPCPLPPLVLHAAYLSRSATPRPCVRRGEGGKVGKNNERKEEKGGREAERSKGRERKREKYGE